MRDRQEIEREMYQAREDLETSLAELKHVVQEKVDFKARARVALEKGKVIAADALERGKQSAHQYALRGKDTARDLARRGSARARVTYGRAKERPLLAALVIGAIVLTGVLVLVGRRRRRWAHSRERAGRSLRRAEAIT
jgi:hypothetical protein